MSVRGPEVVGVSTITFRHRPLDEALQLIAALGAVETELGAIPDVVDHVPVPFDGNVDPYLALLRGHGLRAGAVNADIGDINDPDYDREALRVRAEPLLRLAAATGGSLIVNCGRQSWEDFVDEEADLAAVGENLTFLGALSAGRGVRLLVEVLHHRRWIHTTARADQLLAMVDPSVFGLVLDTAHLGASEEDVVAWAAAHADRVERVHLRDAVPGDLNVGIGRGTVDFAGVIRALESRGFTGSYILELETHDVEEADREADALRSRQLVTAMLEQAG
ncbi:sugar phosphate isomerase/epimerase family protein [Knoellia koreensis]|uniref:Sugar phosphate isomerase/epimerase n=1 Tax=Knoellia koreensis TaxID=2730921 RepID=A0A849HJP4_9MICO|nr:sugar phosphate isomerase/epimerase [Knoellia sp. DB2414S]NNM46764.1 sugar phosphate isomerase/epimerase [Knoellia sp. DB2414S]